MWIYHVRYSLPSVLAEIISHFLYDFIARSGADDNNTSRSPESV